MLDVNVVPNVEVMNHRSRHKTMIMNGECKEMGEESSHDLQRLGSVDSHKEELNSKAMNPFRHCGRTPCMVDVICKANGGNK
jgi:hypothetical protein